MDKLDLSFKAACGLWRGDGRGVAEAMKVESQKWKEESSI
jgi:hypothetical protein